MLGKHMAITNNELRDTGVGLAGLRRTQRRLSLDFSDRRLILVVLDVVCLLAALVLTLNTRSDLDRATDNSLRLLLWVTTLLATWAVCSSALRCYDLVQAARMRHVLGNVGGAVLLTSTIYLITPYLTPALPASRTGLLLFPLLSLVFVSAWRMIYCRVLAGPGFQQRVLIIGAGDAGRLMAQTIASMNGGPSVERRVSCSIIGFVDDSPALQGVFVERVPVLGTCNDLIYLVDRLHPDEIIIADSHAQMLDNRLFEAVLACREIGIPISTMAQRYEDLTNRLAVEHIGRAVSAALPSGQYGAHRLYLLAQRCVDILVSLVGCLVLALVIPLVWVSNRLTSPGPLFYRQPRVGRGGQTFGLIKFRSMIVDAEKYTGVVWASENDPRITPAGRWLRKSRLDEIPQFWNILLGEMSLVGPRPERPQFVSQLAAQIPFYRLRHAVRPGLTGWAQICYAYGASVEDALIKLQYDLYYIKYQSLRLDLFIMYKTIAVVIGLKGR